MSSLYQKFRDILRHGLLACGIFIGLMPGLSHAGESDSFGLVYLVDRTGKSFLCTDDSIDVATYMVIKDKSSLSNILSGIEWSRISIGGGKLTISQQLKQVRHCTMYFGTATHIQDIMRDFGISATRSEARRITNAEFRTWAQEAKTAGEKAAILRGAVSGCEADVFARIAGPTPDRLALVRIKATDGETFTADRSFSHSPGDRILLFPTMWNHDLETITLTYSVPLTEPGRYKSVAVECSVNSRGERTGAREIQ